MADVIHSDSLPAVWAAWAQRALTLAALVVLVVSCVLMEGCRTLAPRGGDPGPGWKKQVVRMEVTGYDSGPRSCNWRRDWLGRPVVASGPDKGRRKVVGLTASGVRARRGTAAADTRHWPFGTMLYVPGYGWARVEDRGGAIKGPGRLDLWFSSEREARAWGRRKDVPVTVWTKE